MGPTVDGQRVRADRSAPIGGVSSMLDSRVAWLFLTPLLVGCQSTTARAPRMERYLATERRIEVGVAPGLCVAVDLHDAAGVWWWEPGRSGCGSRSTGPGVFHPEGAKVTRSAQSGAYEVAFRLGTQSTTRPFIDVRLLVESGTMRVAGSKEGVPLVGRSDLEIPEMPPGR